LLATVDGGHVDRDEALERLEVHELVAEAEGVR
jgi:hypothetical protein